MTTITQTITALPDPPSRADPTNFDSRTDAFLDGLPDFGIELNAFAGQANTVGGEINSNAATAVAAATTAAEAADAVLSQGTTADAWASGTTYDQYDVAIGSDGLAYRSMAGTNTNHDPTTDDGTWWRQLNPDPYLVGAMLNGNGVYPGWDFAVQDPDGTYPPTDAEEPEVYLWSNGVERYKATLTWGTTGGEQGAVTTAIFEYSSDSGSTYAPAWQKNQMDITYATNGAVIAAAWSVAP